MFHNKDYIRNLCIFLMCTRLTKTIFHTLSRFLAYTIIAKD